MWKSIPPERMNGIPSIGINIHTEGTERYEDVEMDILSGKVIDLEVLDYVPDITDDPKAIEVIAELLDKLAEYKPFAKIEELEEQNYNMIDNVLNNGAAKKEQE